MQYQVIMEVTLSPKTVWNSFRVRLGRVNPKKKDVVEYYNDMVAIQDKSGIFQ